eukprot:scaffold1311_cov256-Pinguiococcus_pyrenoidosus.AAC.69
MLVVARRATRSSFGPDAEVPDATLSRGRIREEVAVSNRRSQVSGVTRRSGSSLRRDANTTKKSRRSEKDPEKARVHCDCGHTSGALSSLLLSNC